MRETFHRRGLPILKPNCGKKSSRLHYDKKIVANNRVDARETRGGGGKGIALEYEKSYEMRKKGRAGGGRGGGE